MCSMKKLFILIAVLVIGAVIAWQFRLHGEFAQRNISCGGDWSYNVACPFGSYCRSLDQGPLAGGVCAPLLGHLFKNF